MVYGFFLVFFFNKKIYMYQTQCKETGGIMQTVNETIVNILGKCNERSLLYHWEHDIGKV